MRTIFLSASIPDPKRHPRFFETADMVAIADAVHALCTVVLPTDRLVFGSHLAITPIVQRVAALLDRRDGERDALIGRNGVDRVGHGLDEGNDKLRS